MKEVVGTGKVNTANELMTIDEFEGPVAVIAQNVGSVSVELSFVKSTDLTTPLTTDVDTAVTAENTGYTGDTATLTFSGQVLNHLPIIPKTIEVKPTAGGDTVNAKDLNGDGLLYTSDVDLDECGYVNYFTGAITLYYPTGKAPNTGAISADYKYSSAIVAQGIKMYKLPNLKLGESIKVYGTSQTSPAQIHVGAFGLAQ